MITIKNYLFQTHHAFKETIEQFNGLTQDQKIATLSLAILASIPTLGLAFYPVFHILTKKFNRLNSAALPPLPKKVQAAFPLVYPQPNQKDRVCDPFNFLGLPQDIKQLVFSWLALKKVVQMRRISKEVNRNVDHYLQCIKIRIKHLQELSQNLNNKSAIKAYQACFSAMLKEPSFEKTLTTHVRDAKALFDHLLSFTHPSALWEKQNLAGLQKLLNPLLSYASDQPLVEIAKKSQLFIALVESITLFDPERQRGITAALYQKLPNHEIWQLIKGSKGGSFLAQLRPIVIGLEILALCEKEKEEETLFQEVCQRLKLFSYERRETEIQEMLEVLLPVFGSLEMGKRQVCIKAIAKDTEAEPPLKNTYIYKMMSSNKKEIFAPLLKEYLQLNITSRCPLEQLEYFLVLSSTKEHAMAFIEACLLLPEPQKTLHFRFLFSLENQENERVKLMSEAMKTLQIDRTAYPPLSREIFKLSFHWNLRKFFGCLNQMNEEDLKRIVSDPQNPTKKILRILAGGIIISPSLIIKSSIDLKTAQLIFEKNGFIFDYYNQAITLEDCAAS